MRIRKNEKGFTIIEVVLVLAIAGLIFMMVFVALPALQRAQRDTQRKDDLSRLNTALTSYTSNNNGKLPDGSSNTTTWDSFVTRYVKADGNDSFTDPSGEDYKLSTTATLATKFDATQPVIVVTVGAICNGEGLTTGQGSRKVAFQMKLEGSGVACLNN